MTNKHTVRKESDHYRNGKFYNLSDTPAIAADSSLGKVLRERFQRPASVFPAQPLPSVKTDLRALYSDTPTIVWFGHSSYLIHCRGTNILVDPVFSGHASPLPTMIKAFPGADAYKVEDMPTIDIMVLTHNHYDHLDKKTITGLKPQTRAYYMPLGVGCHVAGCSVNDLRVTELDWWETIPCAPGITLTATPGRHFSGRGLRRNGSLWASFVLELYGYKIFIGGDSGYDTHFKTIGDQYGPFDIALLECGQYNDAWPYIHMKPAETAQAAIDLRAKALMPVHWAKFTLANHPWNEPIQLLTKAAAEKHLQLATPRIGEPVVLGQPYPHDTWW